MTLLRGLLVAGAVLACAWFAVGIRQARNTDRATAALTSLPTVSAAKATQITSWLNAAAWLNPDRQVDVLRGKLALREHEARRAERVLLGVTSSEPMNLQAWLILSQAGFDADHAMFSQAVRELARLDPRL
jgi:hypothetical protein